MDSMLDSKLLRILIRFERRFGYWKLDSNSWMRACAKYAPQYKAAMQEKYANE